MIYKVSFVVPGRRDLGGIQNMEQQPRKGDRVQVGEHVLEIIEVIELLPARGDFAYLHATCKLVEQPA